MEQSFRSTSSYVEGMQEYTMTQECIVFRFIFNFSTEMLLLLLLLLFFLLLKPSNMSIAPFSFEHCRLNYSCLASHFSHRNVAGCFICKANSVLPMRCMLCTSCPCIWQLNNNTKPTTNNQFSFCVSGEFPFVHHVCIRVKIIFFVV